MKHNQERHPDAFGAGAHGRSADKGHPVKLIGLFITATVLTGGVAMASEYQQAEIYTDLRNKVLSLTQEQLGIESQILAVLMETGYPEAVATLVSVADGSSSIYFSNGGGIIGAGEYKQVHDSAVALVKIAGDNQDKFTLTKEYPLPKNGYTRFYLVTNSGVYTEQVLEDDLGNERHALSPVFFQGHELISYIRVAEDHRSAEQGAAADR